LVTFLLKKSDKRKNKSFREGFFAPLPDKYGTGRMTAYTVEKICNASN
jgi:hypothetical protein